jgi:cell division transport system permease protein
MKLRKRRQQTKEVKQPKLSKAAKPEGRQTKNSRRYFADKLRAYRDINAHALFSSLGRLVATPFTSMMTVAVLAIAISLASGFYLFLVNLQQLTGNLESTAQISLFLKDNVSDASANKLADTIRQNPIVQEVNLISREQGLADFKTYSGFGAAISALDKNPLPIVVQVIPKNTLESKQGLTRLLHDFQQQKEVDIAEMDMQWVERLQAMMDVAHTTATLLNLILGLSVLFIISNTIRLEFHSRRDEVIIAKLVGATNGFIKRPFLYCGFWIGFISGVSSWFIVTVMLLILRQSIETLSALYGGSFHLLFFSFTDTVKLLFISSALGVLGSWVVISYQLQKTKIG